MAILPVKCTCILTIIVRGAPLLLLVVLDHGGCCKIFGIWNNRLIGNSFWKIVCRRLGWVPTRTIYLWPAVFPGMDLFYTHVTSHIWPGRWPSSRATTIFTAAGLEVNLTQSFVYLVINVQSVCLRNWRLFLRNFFDCIRFPPLLIHNIAVFSRSLLYKVLMGYGLILWYGIHVAHTKFLDKIRNLLLILNISNTESGVRSILKDASDVT